MSKLTLVPISGANNITNVNDNFKKIERVVNDELLSRDLKQGDPNQMKVLLDMNNQRIINLPNPVSDGEPIPYRYLSDLNSITSAFDDKLDKANQQLVGATAANVEAKAILADTHQKLDNATGVIATQTSNSLSQINATSTAVLADINATYQDVVVKYDEIKVIGDEVRTDAFLVEQISAAFAGGSIGFDANGYDFGYIADSMTYFNRDFGTL